MGLETLTRQLKQVWDVYNSPLTGKQKANYWRYLRQKPETVARYEPVRLSLVATGACNLKCDMCHSHSPQMPENYAFKQEKVGAIGYDLFQQALDKHESAYSLDIIGGGEPLLNPDLFKIIDYAAGEKHMVVKTFSNGLVLHKFVDKLLDSKLSGLTVSLNGHDGAEYDRLTKQGAAFHELIVKNLRQLIAERDRRRPDFKVKVSFILDRENYSHLGEMLDLARSLPADKVFLCNFLHAPFAGSTAAERSIYDDHTEILASMRAAIDAQPAWFRQRIDPPGILEREPKGKKCDVHHTQLRIDGDGNVNSCSTMLLKMKGHGHVLDDDLWNNKFFTGMRRMFLDDKAPLPEPCKVCPNNHGVPLP
jgi:MoaA/NifB/PqqE/SkfB family radical SAM enzyme